MTFEANRAKTFMLEGNIGAGKSTFLKMLSNSNIQADMILEPTDQWQHIGVDGNILDLFYKDTSRWAYTFQSYAFITRVKAQIESLAAPEGQAVQVFERSVYCDRYCFARNCFEAGTMSNVEWQIYKEWFDWLITAHVPLPTGFIYLRTDPEVCYERLLKRNRSEESGVPLSYLTSLHNRHEDWLISKIEIAPLLQSVPVLVLDCNVEFENNVQVQQEFVERVNQFIESLSLPVQHLEQAATGHRLV